MTVTTTTRKTTFVGTGANTALATGFPFVETDDVQVIQRVTATGVETVLTAGVHYNITGGDYSTGTVTPIDGATDFPATVTWTLQRMTDRTQETDYTVADAFPAESHEKALDKLTMLQQEASEDADRALKVPVGDGASTEIPNSVDRASKSLGFDASGNPIALAGTVSGSVTVTSFMETLLDDANAAAGRATLGAQEDVVTTRGDLVRGDASGDAERVALGASGRVLASDGSDAAWTDPKTLAAAYPPGHLHGLTLSQDTDADHDIAIASGSCRDEANAANLDLAATLTKQIDASWAAGDDAGGFPSGLTLSNDTWYHVFLIRNPTTGVVDAGFDTSLTAVNLLADATGFTQYKLLESVLTDGSSNIVDFTHLGRVMLWSAPPEDIDTASQSTTAISYTLSTPLGRKVQVLANIAGRDAAANVYFSSLDQDDVSAGNMNTAPLRSIGLVSGASVHDGHGTHSFFTNTSSQIRCRASAAADEVQLATIGWIDLRGRV